MKKILEILQYGETDIRFKTDFKASVKPDTVVDLVTKISFAMMTSLWGGNEQDVIAVIRALTLSDLAVSVNRKEMIRMLDKDSEFFAKAIRDAHRDFQKSGGKVVTFVPGTGPAKPKS